MRRTAAATAASLLAALALAGPLASTAGAAPATLQCASSAPPPACALLDDLAAQLEPVSPLLGAALAPLTVQALSFASVSDQPAGVPTAAVVQVSRDLLAQLGALPEPVAAVVGAAGLDALTDTLRALVAELTAPVTGDEQQSTSGGSPATPAARSGSSSPLAPSDATSGGDSGSAGTTSSGSAPSGAAVPDVPVGDPLTLGPLALPDFGFDPAFEPALSSGPSAEAVQQAAFDEALEELTPSESRATELAVVAVLSLLLLAGAGVAQLQANRHQIPD
jgi:hypothetical protein